MANGIYVGMSAAVARAAQLQSIADNLANANTPGFKAARPAFEHFLAAGGNGTQVPTAAVDGGIDLRPGPVMATGRPLDVLPDGGAFLGVVLPSGETAFTRDGRLTVDAQGNLLAAGGLLLGRSGQPIAVPPGATPTLDVDGTVRASGVEVDRVALFALEGPAVRLAPSQLRPGDGGTVRLVEGGVRPGHLEGGNAAPVEAAVALVSAQRAFDQALQALDTYKRLSEKASELGRVR
jgi:flagellar basal-body rod protein FlgF